MKPKIVLINKLDEGKTNGSYLYSDEDQENCKIFISKDGQEPSRTLIHESIHHTIREMKKDARLKKLAHRIFRRENFVSALAHNLSKNLKFEVVSTKN